MIAALRALVVTVLVAVGASACASAGHKDPDARGGGGGMTAAEMERIYLARLDSARMRYTEADVAFMSSMIHHHAQALEMARLAPDRSTSEQVLTLAARIINAQNDEIATMQRWLRDRQQPVPMPDSPAMAGMDHDHHAMHMPGMASPEQLAMLREARGVAFDRLFLTLMIPHHEGAVTMVNELFATDGAAQDEEVFKFASDAQVDQATEVARMKLMLEALP